MHVEINNVKYILKITIVYVKLVPLSQGTHHLFGSSNAAKDMHCDTAYCGRGECLSLIISTFNVLSLEFRKDCFKTFYGFERMDFLIVDEEYLDTDLNQ